MNISNRSTNLSLRQFNWDAFVLLIVTFWLSSSVLLDFFMMPMMYESGMMNDPGFATGSYSLFWLFNRVELLCAASILTGLLVIREKRSPFDVVASGSRSRWALIIAGGLMAIAMSYTYFLTPHLSAMGLSLNQFAAEATPVGMGGLHLIYWTLEVIKLAGAALLVKLCYRDIAAVFR